MEQFDLKDLYAVLGVNKNATQEEIKKKFRNLSKKYHPDVKETGNKDIFQKIQNAYEILGDEEKRGQYDRGELNGNPHFGGHGFPGFEDFFQHFGGFGGFQRQRGGGIYRGTDLRVKVTLTIHEILTGVHKTIKLNRDVRCKECAGRGGKNGPVGCRDCGGSGIRFVQQHTPIGVLRQQTTCQTCRGEGSVIHADCKSCSGRGVVSMNDTVEFDVPPGATDGINLSVSNVGNEAKATIHGAGPTGSLIIEVVETEHELFKRDGINVVTDVYISFADAVMGNDSLEIETIEGLVKVKIEPGTESGKILRLRGRGLPDITQQGHRGDHIVFLNIFVPAKLDEEDLKSLSKLKKNKAYNPTKESIKQRRGIFGKIQDYNSLH